MKIHMEMLRGSYANEVFGQGATDLRHECVKAFSRITWHPAELRIEDLDYMMDYFLSVMLKNNYYVNLSDERHEIFDKGLKLTVQRHYLKPGRKSPNGLFSGTAPRQFGIVFIEHHFNSRYNALCISANYFGERSFLSFERLMEVLLS